MLTLKVRRLKGFLSKSIGLLGSEKADPMYFTTRFGVHTFGMKFPIDVIVLDSNNRVMKTAENLKPNRFFFWLPIYNRIVELSAGTIRKLKIRKRKKSNWRLFDVYTLGLFYEKVTLYCQYYVN